jgi:hypothetical protein
VASVWPGQTAARSAGRRLADLRGFPTACFPDYDHDSVQRQYFAQIRARLMNGEQLSFLEQLTSRMRLGSGAPAKRLSPIEAESGRGVGFHKCCISHNNMQGEGMWALLGSNAARPVEVAPLHDRVAVSCNNMQLVQCAGHF